MFLHWLKPIESIGNAVSTAVQARATVQKVKLENIGKIAQGKIDLRMAKVTGKIDLLIQGGKAAQSYDEIVLANRNRTKADEFLIYSFMSIFLLPFFNGIIYAVTDVDLGLDDAVTAGWAAHGYKTAPWWFSFGIVGILVSTLGLLQVLKIFVGMGKKLPFVGKGPGGEKSG